MRIAVVSDIHGNLSALEAVVEELAREKPDLVLHGGDLALSGSSPAEVIDRIRELGWAGVVGNTDELLWRPDELAVQEARAPKLRGLLRILFELFAPATRERIGQERLDWLRALPAEIRHGDLLLLHASPGDLWRAPTPDEADAAFLDVYGDCEAATAIYGHIHRPFVRALPELTVANSGSVGMPYDGDPRASYLLIDDGEPEVRRVEYGVEREVAALMAGDYPLAGWLARLRREARFTPPPPIGSPA